MAVLDPDAPPDERSLEDTSGARMRDNMIHVEPLVELEWLRAVEPTGPIGAARRPSHTRRAWIHRAPESEVLRLFTMVRTLGADLPAPWWLRALAAGRLQSRLGGFAVEDQVSDVLEHRPGWMYMPWTGPGEDGYWEYVPSESNTGVPVVPTTVLFTDRHAGWLDVMPAHGSRVPDPRPLAGPAELRRVLDELERG